MTYIFQIYLYHIPKFFIFPYFHLFSFFIHHFSHTFITLFFHIDDKYMYTPTLCLSLKLFFCHNYPLLPIVDIVDNFVNNCNNYFSVHELFTFLFSFIHFPIFYKFIFSIMCTKMIQRKNTLQNEVY